MGTGFAFTLATVITKQSDDQGIIYPVLPCKTYRQRTSTYLHVLLVALNYAVPQLAITDLSDVVSGKDTSSS